MAAVFLVTLFEYSPLFYICVITLCFVVTAALVLGWFGFDVPVILRSSYEGESVLPTPERRMVQVTNPFALELGPGPASVTDGVSLRPCCLQPCELDCFWGCDIQSLQRALRAHQHGRTLGGPQNFLQNLSCLHHQSFTIGADDGRDRRTHIPDDLDVSDFGPLPRERYPLVAVLTPAEPEAGGAYDIVSSVTVIHVPDHRHRLSTRVVFQYLLTAQGNMYDLKPLFMSADSPQAPEPTTIDEDERGAGAEEQSRGRPREEEEEEEQEQAGGRGRDCVVCQNAPVNRVLLPCRHASVCDGCSSRFQHCPICRAFIIESFTLTPGGGGGRDPGPLNTELSPPRA